MIDLWFFLVSIASGVGVGYMIVQVNLLIPVIFGKNWQAKDAWWRNIISVAAFTASTIIMVWIFSQKMTFITFIPTGFELIAFAAALILSAYVGILYGNIQLKKAKEVVTGIVNAMFPAGETISLGAKEVGAAAKMINFLEKVGGPYTNAIYFMANIFDTPFFSWYFLSIFTRFSKLSEEHQQLFVQKWINDPNFQIRGLAQAFKAMGSLGYYTDPRIWKEIGFAGPLVPEYPEAQKHDHDVPNHTHVEGDQNHPVPQRNKVPESNPNARILGISRFQERTLDYSLIDSDRVINADVCIIGSGAGGGVIAKELCGEDKIGNVVLIEKGPYYDGEDFNQREIDQISKLWKGGGLTFNDNYHIFIGQGEALGGTTIINHAICIDTPRVVLEEWANMGVSEWITDRANFQTILNQVKNEIKVKPVPDSQINRNNEILRDGAVLLGIPNTGHAPNPRNHFDCTECGFSHLGCHYSAKQSTLVTYIPQAIETGKCQVFCDCNVEKITYENKRCTGVDAVFMTKSGDVKYKLRVNAKIVIVAAGAINSSALLLRSNTPNDEKQIGIGLSIHPSPLILADFNEELVSYRGIPMSYHVGEYSVINHVRGISHDAKPITSDRPEDQRGGFALESVFPNPGQLAAFLPGIGEDHQVLMKRLNHYAAAGILIRDTPNGKVTTNMSGDPIVNYSLDVHDKRNLCNGIRKLAEIYLKQNANSVIITNRTKTVITQQEYQDNSDVINERIRPELCGEDNLILGSVHPQGGNRMGEDCKTSVVDSHGKHHHVDNLFVCDASVFPTATGVNPMLTIMGIAKRTAKHIIDDWENIIRDD